MKKAKNTCWGCGTAPPRTALCWPAECAKRGLDTESALLVVLDGAKALHKAVKEVFGERALIQPLPRPFCWPAERGAWAGNTPEAALKELRAVVKWPDPISPSAARSLEEGLEETLTLHRLGINPDESGLRKSLSSTNLIGKLLCAHGGLDATDETLA